MSPFRTITLAVVLVFGMISFFSSCTVVDSGHRGVVTHMGKVQEGVLDEGVHFTAPFVTYVHELSVRTTKNIVKADSASKDLQPINVDLALNWHLDATKVNTIFQSIGDEEAVMENIISPASNEAFKAASARYSAAEILAKREQLKQEVDVALAGRLKKYGVILDDLSIVEIKFTEDFMNAVEAKQVAEQEAQKAKYVADQARAMADAKVNEARGKAEAQRMLNITLTSQILTLQAIEKWDGHFPQVMGAGTLPFINIALKGQAPAAQ